MKLRLISILIFAFAYVLLANASTTILPTDPNIQYIGRFDKTNPLIPIMYWTGSEIRINFQGTSLGIKLSCWNLTYNNVTIDGVTTVLQLQNTGNSVTYPLCSGLAEGTHTAIIYKRDSPWTPQCFYGFILDDGKSIVTPPERKIRRIEFYGDSQTQGAQVEVPGLGNDINQTIYDNNYYSYAAITARALNAEYTCVARNGATLTPYNGKQNIPDVYDRIGVDATIPLWNFNGWLGDVVCIDLGVNDSPFPADFTTRYISFVQKIRADHPNAYIFLLAGPLWNSDALKNAIKTAVTTLNSNGDSKVYYMAFTTSLRHSGHPRIAENVSCAKELVTKIKSVIWNEEVPNLSVQDVYITPIPSDLVVGGKQQLIATVSSFDAMDKVVIWTSSKENILKVNSTGLVTAISTGSAVVTVTTNDGGKKFSFSINVVEPILTNLILNPGFESPLLIGWSSDWGNTRLNSTSFKTGAYSLEISPAGGRTQTVNSGFVVGGTYTLSAWGKILSGSAGSYIGVQCKDASNNTISTFNSTNIISTTAYERKVVTFVIPENTTSILIIGYLFAANSSILLDDFELIMGSKPTGLFALKSTTYSIKLFPNPLTGKVLYVSSLGLLGEKTFSILDLTGKLVFTQKLSTSDSQIINMNGLDLKGTYIAKLSNDEFQHSELLIIN